MEKEALVLVFEQSQKFDDEVGSDGIDSLTDSITKLGYNKFYFPLPNCCRQRIPIVMKRQCCY